MNWVISEHSDKDLCDSSTHASMPDTEQLLQWAVWSQRESCCLVQQKAKPGAFKLNYVRVAIYKKEYLPFLTHTHTHTYTWKPRESISSTLSPISKSSHSRNPYDQYRSIPKGPRWRKTVQRWQYALTPQRKNKCHGTLTLPWKCPHTT